MRRIESDTGDTLTSHPSFALDTVRLKLHLELFVVSFTKRSSTPRRRFPPMIYLAPVGEAVALVRRESGRASSAAEEGPRSLSMVDYCC